MAQAGDVRCIFLPAKLQLPNSARTIQLALNFFLTPIDPARTDEILMPHPLHHSIFRWPASLHPGHQRRRAAAATGGRRTSRLPPPHASLRGPCRPNQSRSSIPGGAARLEGARAGSAAPSGGCLWLAATVAACPATSSATSFWYPTPPFWPQCPVLLQ